MIDSDSDKKVHQGSGGDEGNTDLKVEEEGAQDAVAEAPPAADWGIDANANDDAWAAPAAPAEGDGETKDAAPPAEARVEEEDKTMTLDEYLAQQKKSLAVPQLEVRQINDDDTFGKGTVKLDQKEEEDYFVGKVTRT